MEQFSSSCYDRDEQITLYKNITGCGLPYIGFFEYMKVVDKYVTFRTFIC